jgi:hypothetical protein
VRCLLQTREWEFTDAVLAWASRGERGSIGRQADRIQKEASVKARQLMRLALVSKASGQRRAVLKSFLLATLAHACRLHSAGQGDLADELTGMAGEMLPTVPCLEARLFLVAGRMFGWDHLESWQHRFARSYDYWQRTFRHGPSERARRIDPMTGCSS